MKIDMTPRAITIRLKQTSALRRLCLALGGDRLKVKREAGFRRKTKKES